MISILGGMSMYCHNCGHKAKDEDRFCTECGILLSNFENPKIITITCEDCNGIMEVDLSRRILTCPSCGSKKLLVESDEVTIARINKEADSERMRYEKEKNKYNSRIREKIEYDEYIREKRENEEKEVEKSLGGWSGKFIIVGGLF